MAYTAKEFKEHLQVFQQVQSFAKVGAHHSNRRAEAQIKRIVMSIAWTIMLALPIKYLAMADVKLWPMAVEYSVFLANHLPTLEDGLSPNDIFT